MKACWIASACFAVAVASACLWESWRHFSGAFGGHGGPAVLLGPRRTVERFVPRGERVTLYRSDSVDRPSHVCRSIFLSMAWAAGAGNVEEKRSLDGTERYVLVAPVAFTPDSLPGNPAYREYRLENVGRIWIREGAPVACSAPDGVAPSKIRDDGIAAIARECADWREALGLVAPLALALALLGVGLRRMPPWQSFVCAFAVFALNAMFALSHTFTGPCGTGVFGGRAKALVESGWDFSTLANPNMGEYFQAAYPPLQAVVTAVGYAVAGCCGEWLTQLGPVVFLAAAFLVLDGMSRDGADGSPAMSLLLAASCLTGPMVRAAGNFCAEPLMVLVVASGWSAVRRGNDRGWFLIGLAGLVKNEGLFYAPAIAVAEMAAGRLRLRGLPVLALGLVPVALWHFGCRWMGASLYDYAAPWQCDPAKAFAAARALLLEMALHPWRYAFVFVVLAVCVRAARHAHGIKPRLRAAAMAALPPVAFFCVCAAGICYAFSLSRAPDFAWHVSCLARLLAPVSILALANSQFRIPVSQSGEGQNSNTQTLKHPNTQTLNRFCTLPEFVV